MVCILHKCLILVGNGTEYSYSCSHSQYSVYVAYISSMSCLNVSSSYPPMPRQIEVWAVSNLTFVLHSFTLLHSTTEISFIVLVIYSLRPGTQKVLTATPRGLCAGYTKMYLKHYMPFQVITDVQSHTDLLCNVIRFGGCTICVARSTSMII